MKQHTKKRLFQPIIVGFFAFYLTSMLFITYLLKINLEDSYNTQPQNHMQKAADDFFEIYQRYEIYQDMDSEEVTNLTRYYLSKNLSYTQDYNQISGALYNDDNKLIATSESLFGPGLITIDYGKQRLLAYPFFDYFTDTERNRLLTYYDKSLAAIRKGELDPYGVRMIYDTSTYEPIYIDIIKQNYETSTKKIGTTIYNSMPELKSKKEVWHWKNPNWYDPNVDQGIEVYSYETDSLDDFFLLPYYRYFGRKQWMLWTKDNGLHNFSKIYHNINDQMTYSSIDSSDITSENEVIKEFVMTYLNNSEHPYDSLTLLLKNHPRPLLHAVDYLKYIYITVFVLLTLCLLLVFHSMKKSYLKNQQLIQSKRDFINAITHELKTPLGIIRGFSENIKEQTIPEKEIYYLEQIRNQTKYMHQLVSEIEEITQLDSHSFTLKKDTVSINFVLKEQLARLKPLIVEKNLTVSYEMTEDFILTGDAGYLSKMLWNLLENAITYNLQNGFLIIKLTNRLCQIENTGDQISPEDMPYLFDLFYTNDKSRTSSEKHFGLGLYLARKICYEHQLLLSIENTDSGVITSIRKEDKT